MSDDQLGLFGAPAPLAVSATTPPPALLAGEWHFNELVPGWRVGFYDGPPISLDPIGHGGEWLLPPAGFMPYRRQIKPYDGDRNTHVSVCPHCRAGATQQTGGPGWWGFGHEGVRRAFERAEAAGVQMYGLTEIDDPDIGAVNPMAHWSRWLGGYCCACGALTWQDFSKARRHFYHAPTLAPQG